jgi:hypothetical protein
LSFDLRILITSLESSNFSPPQAYAILADLGYASYLRNFSFLASKDFKLNLIFKYFDFERSSSSLFQTRVVHIKK